MGSLALEQRAVCRIPHGHSLHRRAATGPVTARWGSANTGLVIWCEAFWHSTPCNKRRSGKSCLMDKKRHSDQSRREKRSPISGSPGEKANAKKGCLISALSKESVHGPCHQGVQRISWLSASKNPTVDQADISKVGCGD